MENVNIKSEKDLDFNKEEKYRKEIFELLKGVLGEPEVGEIDLFQDIFVNDIIHNEELLDKIKSLK